MNKRNKTVTNGPWGVSATSGSGINGEQLNVYRYLDGKIFKDGKLRFLHGQLDGMNFERYSEERIELCLTYGYLKRYGRNTCKFVMSRAARKRGIKTTDGMYLRDASRAGK